MSLTLVGSLNLTVAIINHQFSTQPSFSDSNEESIIDWLLYFVAVYALGLATSEKQSKIKIQYIGFYISYSYVTSICVISYVIQISSQSK